MDLKKKLIYFKINPIPDLKLLQLKYINLRHPKRVIVKFFQDYLIPLLYRII